MIRKLWPLLAAAVVFAATAQAQVAAPELIPAAPRFIYPGLLSFSGANITPDNPAALQWNETSLVAFGVVNHTDEIPPIPSDKYSGWFAGYRGAWERFSLGVEHMTMSIDAGSYDESATSVHASMQVLDGLSIGFGIDRSEYTSGVSTQNEEENTFGFSVNLAEQFYLGYAIGSDKFENSAALTGSRSTTLYGIAFRTDGDWRWHLAYDALDKDNFTNGVGNGFDASTITVQLGIGNWVLGAQSVDYAFKFGGLEASSTILDVGWVPKDTGLSVTARLTDGGLTAPLTSNDTGTSVNIAYQF